MSDEDLADVAAEVLAATVAEYRGRGVTNEALVAAGMPGVQSALEKWNSTRGYEFETWCRWWVRQAIARSLESKQPPAPRVTAGELFPERFDDELRAREATVSHDLERVRKRHHRQLEALVAGKSLSPFALSLFDLFIERYPEVIEPWLSEHVEREVQQLNRNLGDDEQLDSAFSLHALVLPTPGATTWTVILELDDSDHLVHFDFDRWTLLGIAWSD